MLSQKSQPCGNNSAARDTHSSLHKWALMGGRPSTTSCCHNFVLPAKTRPLSQGWSCNADKVGDEGSDRLVGGYSSYLQTVQLTDKPAFSTNCPTCSSIASGALLGMLGSLLDSISCDFVFGPTGMEGRPPGISSIAMLNILDVGQMLSREELHRWHQVVSVWCKAGWRLSNLQVITSESRPLSYGSGLSLTDVAGVAAHDVDDCIIRYCHMCGYVPSDLRCFQDFLGVLKQNFASSNNVLLPAKDVLERLSRVAVLDSLTH